MNVESPCVRLGYEWDDNTGINFLNTQSGNRPGSPELFFDEETGRCLLRETRTEVWVFDFITTP